MLVLLETLFDIIRLRRGPDAIPYSWALCLIAMTLWLFAGFTIINMSPELDDRDYLLSTFTGVVGLACYAAIVVLSGHTPRLLQTVTAVLGCGAVLSFMFVAAYALLGAMPFLSDNAVNVVTTLILLWSVPVEGHIIARAIDRHWYIGIVAAIAVFIFQLYLFSLLGAEAGTAG